MSLVGNFIIILSGMPTQGARRARIALNTELFPYLLSCIEALSAIKDSLAKENFSEGKPPDYSLNWL